MPDIELTALDISEAETYLEALLREKYPNLDFGPGSVLRDLIISPFSYIYSVIRKQYENIRNQQSLLTLQNIETEDAALFLDRILSNWMLTRGSGNYARGFVVIELTEKTDLFIPSSQPFVSRNLNFVVDTEEQIYVVSQNALVPVVDSLGTITGYRCRIPVKAASPGIAYNLEPGSFQRWPAISPYVSAVYNEEAFSGGKDIETNADLADRAKTAISIRDLNSARSITAVLRDQFSFVEDVVVKGFGDSEVKRGYNETFGVYMGGYADAFIRTPMLYNQQSTAVVGELINDPRPGYYVLRDVKISDFLGLSNLPTNPKEAMIKIYNSQVNEPALYHIDEIVSSGIRVPRLELFPKELPEVAKTFTQVSVNNDRVQTSEYQFQSGDIGFYLLFPDNTNGNQGVYEIKDVDNGVAVLEQSLNSADESGVQLCTRIVEYSVGTDPSFVNIITRTKTGLFTKLYNATNRIVLPFVPVGYIQKIELTNAGYPPWEENGIITFDKRVNEDPGTTQGQFQVVCRNWPEFNSGWQICEVVLAAPAGFSWDNANATIYYDTITGYTQVFDYMLNSFRRVSCANIIPRGLFFVYLKFTVQYGLKSSGTAFDHAEAVNLLVDFINNFPQDERLDVSDIYNFIKSNYSQIDFIEPLVLDYDLYVPDGRVIPYQTRDWISLLPNYQIGIGDVNRLPDPEAYGITKDVVRLVTNANLITFERKQ